MDQNLKTTPDTDFCVEQDFSWIALLVVLMRSPGWGDLDGGEDQAIMNLPLTHRQRVASLGDGAGLNTDGINTGGSAGP